MYKVTKLQVRKDAENKKSNEQLADINDEIALAYDKLGVVSGGYYAVEEGRSFFGNIDKLEVGKSLVLVGPDEELVTSKIKSIEGDIVTTANSIYKVEKLS